MKSQYLLIAAVAAALVTTAQAQVKVGSNPSSISANAVLDVEGTSGSHSVILQNGSMGIGTATPGAITALTPAAGYTNHLDVNGFIRARGGVITMETANPAGGPYDNSAVIYNQAGMGPTISGGIIELRTASTGGTVPRLTVGSTGNVGIGTTSPGNLLHVASNDFGGYGGIKFEDNSGSNTTVFTITPGYYGASQYLNNVTLDVAGNGAINFGDGIQCIADNSYDIGSAANRWRTIYATNGTIQTSDMRLKKNVAPLTYGLSQVKALRTITFDWKDGSNKARKVGFSAQQLQSLMPELVNVGDNPEHTLGVNYGELTPVLVNAIQEQQAQIEALKKENVALKAQSGEVASLRSELDAIKALVLKGSPAQKSTSVTKR